MIMDTFQPIAIVGVGAIFANASNATEFWKNIVSGDDFIEDVPQSHWDWKEYYDKNPGSKDKVVAKRGSFIKEQGFDYLKFGIPPSILPQIDVSQLLALLAAEQVLKDCSYLQRDLSRVSVIIGGSNLQSFHLASARLQTPTWEKACASQGLEP